MARMQDGAAIWMSGNRGGQPRGNHPAQRAAGHGPSLTETMGVPGMCQVLLSMFTMFARIIMKSVAY